MMGLRMLLVASVLLCPFGFSTTLAQQPDANWNLIDTSDTADEIEDCTGAANQSDSGYHTHAGKVCQNYNTASDPRDVYETLLSASSGFRDADIWYFRIGEDADFFYFEVETVDTYDYDATGGSREYAFEIDADTDNAADLDRPDFFYKYLPDPGTHITNTWQASDETAPIQAFRDTDNNYGAATVTFSDFDDDGSESKYEEDWKDLGGMGSNSWNWYRIITRQGTLPGPDGEIGTADDLTGSKNIVQIAIRRTALCLTGSAPCTAPTSIAARAWASQGSSIISDKLPWHDHQEATDLSSWDVDNSGGLGELATLPVELTSFEALVDGADALLTWQTASETNNAGFEIQRRSKNEDGAWEVLDFVEGYGTTEFAQRYDYRVEDLEPGRHRFRLKQIDFDGTFEYHGAVEVVVEMAERFVMEAAYPNPFNPEAQFRFAVSRQQAVQVALYDMLGRQAKVLYAGVASPGQMQVVRIDGNDLPSGLYVVRVVGETLVESQTVTLLK